MTRFVTMTVQVRPHGEEIEVDGRTFTAPEELWQHLHGSAARVARKPAQTVNSLFITQEQAEAWAQAFARGEDTVYAAQPGAVGITKCLPGRGLDTRHQEIKGKSLEDLEL